MLCLAPGETSDQIFAGLLEHARVNLTLPGYTQLDLKPGGAQGQDESCISSLLLSTLRPSCLSSTFLFP